MLVVTAVLELVYLDASGSTGAATLHVSSVETVSSIDAQASALASIIASVTDCVIVRQRIKYKVLQVEPPPAAIGSSVKRVGGFYLSTSSTTPDAVILIPGISDAILETSGVRAGYGIDVSNSDVIAFVSELLAMGATNPFADAITALDDAYLESGA